MAPRPSFRDRFFTPKVAQAITSPLGIVMAGAGAAVGIATGLPLVLAAGIGVAAWATRVAVAVPRATPAPRVVASSLSDPWRSFVAGALEAKSRFDHAVAGTRPGPLQDRLREVGQRIQDGVEACWRIAGRGDDIDGALATLDTDGARRELVELHRGPKSPTTQRTIESIEAQVASAERMAHVSADARDRLRLLDARLDEMVARAVELSVSSEDDADVAVLGTDVEGLVGELESLRQAVEETNHTGGSPGPVGASGP